MQERVYGAVLSPRVIRSGLDTWTRAVSVGAIVVALGAGTRGSRESPIAMSRVWLFPCCDSVPCCPQAPYEQDLFKYGVCRRTTPVTFPSHRSALSHDVPKNAAA